MMRALRQSVYCKVAGKENILQRNKNRVKVLRPTPHKIGHVNNVHSRKSFG